MLGDTSRDGQAQPLSRITPLILTYNETPNILRTLDRLTWAGKVIVVDSYSEDGTLDYLKRYPNVEVHFRKFDGFAQQCNYGLSLIETDWVLSLDADYVLPDEFIREMNQIVAEDKVNGAFAAFRYCVVGKPLGRDNTTPRKVLYKRSLATYHNLGHQHRVSVPAPETSFTTKIYHDDRKSLSRWLKSQDGYLTTEAKKLAGSRYGDLDFADKIRKTKVLAPFCNLRVLPIRPAPDLRWMERLVLYPTADVSRDPASDQADRNRTPADGRLRNHARILRLTLSCKSASLRYHRRSGFISELFCFVKIYLYLCDH